MAKQTVIGLFDDHATAERVVDQLAARGFARSDISLVANDVHGKYKTYKGTDTANETTSGAASGAVAGAGIGALLGLGWLLIPGVGPVLTAGHIAAALGVGAAAGAATGGIIG